MRKPLSAIILSLAIGQAIAAPQVKSGKVDLYKKFQSDIVKPRNVYVWLPDAYSPKEKYDVIYMHDGQMLFDGTTSWNKQEWNVDETAGYLNNEKMTRPFIVVGIDNIAEDRWGDYFPEKVTEYIGSDFKLPESANLNADNYLKFLVEEVKPFIDQKYSTNKGEKSTFVAGSSMGGLISLYALCEYPEVFGGAASLSIHTPMAVASYANEANCEVLAEGFREYLAENLPRANSKKIYMDRGDQTLDAKYPKYQDALDELMVEEGWSQPNFVTRVYEGTGHTETAWASRLKTPFQFLVGDVKKEKITRVDPTFWWCGMKNPELQVMIYGNNIASYTPTIEYDGVEIKSIIPLESPNYLLMYLDVADAKPGEFDIVLTKGKKKLKHKYELRERTARTDAHEGFNSSDVIYLLMPDRFANGNPDNDKIEMKRPYVVDRSNLAERHGGDLQGVMDNLDYIEGLGATAIWLNPVLENDMGDFSYHGYAATDYYKVDPRYGTNQEYVATADSLHKRGMKIIMDMVFNHSGSYHPWNLDRPTGDWFNNPIEYVQTNHNKSAFYDPYASEVDLDAMVDGWFVPTMPDFNQRNKYVADYLIQNSIWWIEYVGLNGIRQDTYPYPDYDMMVRWCKEVMAEYPDFNIVGEAWISNPAGAAFWQRGSKLNPRNTELKSVMDFRLQEISGNIFQEETTWGKGLNLLFEHMALDFLYPDVNNVLRFYENHDTDRFLKESPNNLDAFKQAAVFIATIPGIPQIYYGQEQLAYGSTKTGGYEAVRQDMPGGWQEDEITIFDESGRTPLQKGAYDFISKILNWRKGNKIVSEGSMKHFVPINGVYVYTRENEGKRFIVVMNGVTESNSLDWQHYKEIFYDENTRKGVNFIDNKEVTMEGIMELGPKEVMLIEM